MIIKTIFYFLTLFAFAFLATQGVVNTGLITIEWFGYIIEINAMFAIFLLLLFIFLVQIMMHILTILGIMPSVFKYKKEAKKLKNGLDKLKAVSIQLSLGNKNTAKKMAEKANKIIPQYPIFDDLLNLKSKKDFSNEILDLRLAKNQVDTFLEIYKEDKALKIIENILAEHPKSQWARQKQYQILLKMEEFDPALNILELMLKEKIINKVQYKIEKSFILYEMANQEEDYIQALKLLESSIKQNHNFIKTVELSAKILKEEQEQEKALKLVISTAKNFNEGMLSLNILKDIIEDFEPNDQIKWLDKFSKIEKSFVACQLAKAMSLILKEQEEKAIESLRFFRHSKESLEMLSSLEKESGDNLKALESLAESKKFKPIKIDGMLEEYDEWQKNIFEFDKNQNNDYIEQVHETKNILLENETK